MFLVKLMICFYIIIILASIICNISKIKFNSLEGMESLDPLTQAKLNTADIITLEKKVNSWNIDKINKDITSLNKKCGEAMKARDEMKKMRKEQQQQYEED
jgi:hypothetical protein